MTTSHSLGEVLDVILESVRQPGAGELQVDTLTLMFEAIALAGGSVPEIVAQAARLATERLPRGMSLTDARPGCWESSCFEPMIPQDAIDAGPGPEPLDLDCPQCGTGPGEGCWNVRTYVDLPRPHLARRELANGPAHFSVEYGWWTV